MITVKILKRLLNEIPDEALLNAYEGEGVGISIKLGDWRDEDTYKSWWIEAGEKGIDTEIQGVKEG